MNIRERWTWVGLLSAFFLLAAPPQPLRSTVQDPIRFQKPLEHNVAVTLKLVQVYVTDRHGKPIQDLRKSDFHVTDKGIPVTITEFEKHVLEPPAYDPAATGPEKLLSSLTPPLQPTTRKFFRPSFTNSLTRRHWPTSPRRPTPTPTRQRR